MQNRTVIHSVRPQLAGGRFSIKRVVGETVDVSATIFGDGHDSIRAALRYKHDKARTWAEVPMQDHPNDHWTASFTVEKQGWYEYKIEAWVDHLANWFYGFKKKQADGQEMQVELEIGIGHLQGAAKTYSKTKGKPLSDMAKKLASEDYETAVRTVLSGAFASLVAEFNYKQHVTTYEDDLWVWCGRKRELFSSWYELFPRSTSPDPSRPGTFKDTEALLPRIHEMGFNVLYFPPIHPIGKKNRKGRNNATTAKPGEPGSPWAIGSEEGGHKAVLSELGTLDDYKHLIEKARNEYGIDIALDLAFQCAPDHPYITEHPDWFIWRPDGTIAYAENPPKKYQDIVPINFETDDWKNLWEELLSVVLYWCEVGVNIFRVDNPHTKPYRFWEWLIAKVLKQYPDTIFLSEAFTRPAIMAELGKRGFQQSYTYFTWRNTAQDMRNYLVELTQSELREYMRPNFWPNTPDILTYEMMGAGSNQFVKRVILAGTLSSNYGLYGPSYEFMENTGHTSGKEEYYDSEKYAVRHYDWNYRTRVSEVITRLNEIRNNQPALQTTWNIHFTNVDNPNLLSYLKWDDARTNFIWSIVSFDPNQTQSGMVQFPREVLGAGRFEVTDLLTNEIYYWGDDWNFVMLDPNKMPAHILRVQRVPG